MTRWLFYLRKNLVVCVCWTEPLLQLAVATGAPWNCSIVASLWDEMKEIIEGKKNLLTYKTTLYLDWRCNIEEVPVNKKYWMICWLRPDVDLNEYKNIIFPPNFFHIFAIFFFFCIFFKIYLYLGFELMKLWSMHLLESN